MRFKVCTACNVEKSVSDFHKNRSEKDGYQRWCKQCRTDEYYKNHEKYRVKYLKYASEHREEARKRSKKWAKENRDRKIESDRIYRENNRDRIREYFREYNKTPNRQEYQKKWMKEHRKEISEKVKKYYKENPEKDYLRATRYRKENPEKIAEIAKRWRKRHPLKANSYTRRYQALKMSNTVEKVDYEKILERDEWLCHICGGEVKSRKEMHFDHVIPLSKGGEHSQENVSVSHAECNMSKGDRIIEKSTQ